MKTINKISLTATLLGVIGVMGTAQAGPAVFVQNHARHLESLSATGNSGGDKIDRNALVTSTRMSLHMDSLKQSGLPGGDKIDRTLKAVSPKQLENQNFQMAPVK